MNLGDKRMAVGSTKWAPCLPSIQSSTQTSTLSSIQSSIQARVSPEPIRRADEGLEAGEFDVRVDAATPDGAAVLGLQGNVSSGG